MYFEKVQSESESVNSSKNENIDKEQMLIFEGDPYREFPEEDWVAAPVKKGKYDKTEFV